jgi:hypothetical protein
MSWRCVRKLIQVLFGATRCWKPILVWCWYQALCSDRAVIDECGEASARSVLCKANETYPRTRSKGLRYPDMSSARASEGYSEHFSNTLAEHKRSETLDVTCVSGVLVMWGCIR